MRTRRADTGRVWRFIVVALFVCLYGAPATAQVPDAIVQRIAEINVQITETDYLWNENRMDGRTRIERQDTLASERSELERQMRGYTPDQQKQARQKIEGLVRARMAVLEPQWQREKEQRKAAADRHARDVMATIPAGARAALEPQRRRLVLQQRRDRGEISPEEFAAEDKKALDEIMAIRGKYVAEGAIFTNRFDHELDVLTRTAINKPPTSNAPPVRPTRKPSPFSAPPAPAVVVANPSNGILERYALPVLLVGGVGLVIVVAFLIGLRREPDSGPSVSTVYGTAQFSPLITEVQDGDCVKKGVFLGKSSVPELKSAALDAPGVPICSTPENHTLIVAPTRTGKGTRVIVPTLLRYSGSALVIDPKGENAAITARSRRDHLGQEIFILNPWEELAATYRQAGFSSATYNPLDSINRADRNAVAVAQSLADAICPTGSDKKDQFWQGNAASVLAAVFLWLADQPGEQKTLARAREITSLTRKDFTANYLTRMAASAAFSGAIRELSAQFIDMPQETYGGIMGAVNQGMKFLSDPQIKAATNSSSFAMADLIRKHTTVYVVIPPDRMETQRIWLRLVLAAGMHTFKRFPSGERAGHRCMFLIDEFAALGRLDDIPRDIATMSGYGLDLVLIVQGFAQLKDHYREAQGTILSNCGYKWFCNVNDLETAKWLSEALGKKTVATTSTSESQSAGTRSSSQGTSTSHSETARALLNPDEIMNLGKRVAIAIQPHGYPHFLRPVDYWKLQETFAHLKDQHPGLFWEPPLEFDPNPCIPPPPSGSGQGGPWTRDKKDAGGNGKGQSYSSPFRKGVMTPEQARDILGVSPKATREEIMRAYRHLMSKVHPDTGGSKHFAQELNAAKAVLVGE